MRLFRSQAVVLKVGDRRRERGQPSFETTNGSASARRASPAAPGGVRHGAFAAGNGNGEHEDAANHPCPYPLLTADGVWVGEVGAEGSATHVPQVGEHVSTCGVAQRWQGRMVSCHVVV